MSGDSLAGLGRYLVAAAVLCVAPQIYAQGVASPAPVAQSSEASATPSATAPSSAAPSGAPGVPGSPAPTGEVNMASATALPSAPSTAPVPAVTALPADAAPAPNATSVATTTSEAALVLVQPASVPLAAVDEQSADADASLAEARAMQELVGQSQAEAAGREELSLYGFADFTYSHQLKTFQPYAPYDSFAVGKFDVYLSSGLGANWRTLAEVRFTYLPNGVDVPEDGGTWSRQDNTVADYTDLDRPLRWGGIVIERIWLEYTVHPLLTVRAGHWLTPYGIWNVDHGSPVIIGVRRPFIVGESLFPTSQTGIELYGTYDYARTQFGYHLTLSNGRGPIDTYKDLDYNKALGARVYARNDSAFGKATLGVSFYKGRYTDRDFQYVADSSGTFVPERPVTTAYDELSWAADLKLDFNGLLVQSEGILSEVVYDDSVRPPEYSFAGGPAGFQPNYRRYGVYGLAGYRFDFLGVMPFAGLEYYRAGGASIADASAAFWGGINLRPTPQVVLKAQYTYSWFPHGASGIVGNSHFNNLDLQAAWSF